MLLTYVLNSFDKSIYDVSIPFNKKKKKKKNSLNL